MDPEGIESIIQSYTPIIRGAIKRGREFEYITTLNGRLKYPCSNRYYTDWSMDRYNDYHLTDKCNPYESKLWSLQDVTVEMYEDLNLKTI